MKARWFYLVIGLALFVGVPSLGQFEDTFEPINISLSGIACAQSFDCRPAMVAGEGKVFLVWAQEVSSTESALYFSKSDDRGESFSVPQPIEASMGTVVQQPSIDMDANGDVMVAWADNRSGDFDIFITLSTDDGGSWIWNEDGESLNLSDNEGNSLSPSLALDDLGGFTVAWSDDTIDDVINPEGARNIFIRAGTNPERLQVEVGGNVVSLITDTVSVSERFPATLDSPAEKPALAIDSEEFFGNLFIAWQQRGLRALDIFFHQSAGFTPTHVTDSLFTDARQPTIAVWAIDDLRQSKQVVIAWAEQDGSDSQILANSALISGVSLNIPNFSDLPLEVSESNESATDPALTVNQQGEFFVAWESQELDSRVPSTIKLRAVGNAFSPTLDVSLRADVANDATNPAVAADIGDVYVVWVDEVDADNQVDIFFTRRSVRTFGL